MWLSIGKNNFKIGVEILKLPPITTQTSPLYIFVGPTQALCTRYFSSFASIP